MKCCFFHNSTFMLPWRKNPEVSVFLFLRVPCILLVQEPQWTRRSSVTLEIRIGFNDLRPPGKSRLQTPALSVLSPQQNREETLKILWGLRIHGMKIIQHSNLPQAYHHKFLAYNSTDFYLIKKFRAFQVSKYRTGIFSSSYLVFLNTSSLKCSAALGFNNFFKNYIQAANKIFREAMRDQPTSHLPRAVNRAVSAGGWWGKSQAVIKADKPEYYI